MNARKGGLVTLLLGLLVLAFAGPFATPARADDEVSAALANVAKSRSTLTTLQVPFTQERELSLLSSKVTSKGDLILVSPDKMRWRLEAPDEATYWVSKEGIAYRTKDGAGKVSAGQAGGLSSLLDDVMLVVGGDLDKIKTRYDLTARKDGANITLTLTPKQDKVRKLVKRLVVTLDGAGLPRKLVMEEPEGDSTTVVFGEAKKNAQVDPALLTAR